MQGLARPGAGPKTSVRLPVRLNNEQEYCLDDISKSTGMSCGTIYPALSELLETRILTQRKAGRSILYKINKNHTLFKKIKELVETEKNSLLNIAKEFTSNIPKNNISAIILFGSVARQDFTEKSDIDILIASNAKISKKQIAELVSNILKTYDVHIIPIFLTQNEIDKRIKKFDNFIITVIDEGRLLYGEASWLKK